MKEFYNFKNKVNVFLYKLSSKLIIFLLSMNAIFLCSLVIRFNLRKIKKIFCNSKEKRVIVLSKSGGIDDLLASFKKEDIANKIEFFTLPRNLIKSIFFKFLNISSYKDYNTLQNDPKILAKRNNYKNTLKKIFIYLNKYWKFDGIIGFNLFYFAEHTLHEAIHEIKKKSIVIHKESVYPPKEMEYNKILYKKNEPFKGDKISVYNEYEKKLLVESGLADNQQIVVNGCSRLDLAFNYENIEPQKSTILYYMIEKKRFLPGKESFVDWSNLKLNIEKYLIDYAIKNPEKKIVFKGKVGVHERSDLPEKLPKNCIFLNKNAGHELLKIAKVVVGFNSSVVYEAIAAKKNLIVPFFNINYSEVKENLLLLPSSIDLVNSEDDFKKKLSLYCSKKFSKKNLSKDEKEILNFYFGNNDGKSGLKTKLFIENTLYN